MKKKLIRNELQGQIIYSGKGLAKRKITNELYLLSQVFITFLAKPMLLSRFGAFNKKLLPQYSLTL